MSQLYKVALEQFTPILNKFDELRTLTKEYTDIKLPEVVVIGDQSHGKSSLLEMISGVNLPRGQGMKTRVPLEMRLRRLPDGEKEYATIEVSSSHKHKNDDNKANNDGNDISDNVPEIETIQELDGDEISIKIDKLTDKIAGKSNDSTCTVENKPIILTIFKEKMVDLTMVDLPGLIQNAKEHEKGLPEKILAITKRYIDNEESIILNVLQASVDTATSLSLNLSKQYDPKLNRTLLVLTKVDQFSDAGLERKFIMIQQDEKFAEQSIFFTRSRTQQENEDKVSLMQIYENEKQCYKNRADLGHIPAECIGTENLIKKLVVLQKERILATIPKLEEQFQTSIQLCEKKLGEFGKMLNSPSECMGEYYLLLENFFQGIKSEADGFDWKSHNSSNRNFTNNYNDAKEDENSDVEAIITKIEREPLLCADIFKTFQTYGETINAIGSAETILSEEFVEEFLRLSETKIGFSGLPNEIHPLISVNIIDVLIEKIAKPSHDLVENIALTVMQTVKKIVAELYSDYPKLNKLLFTIFAECFENDKNVTKKKIDEILNCELSYKFTLNEDYLNSIRQFEGLMNSAPQSNDTPPTVILLEQKDVSPKLNGVYYLKILRNDYVLYQHINEQCSIVYSDTLWQIKEKESKVIISDPEIKSDVTKVTSWKKNVNKFPLFIKSLSYENWSSVDDKTKLQCLRLVYKHGITNKNHSLMKEAVKIFCFWGIALKRMKDYIPMIIRYNLVSLSMSKERKSELDLKIHQVTRKLLKSSNPLSDEDIICKLMVVDEVKQREKMECEKKLENLSESRKIVQSIQILT